MSIYNNLYNLDNNIHYLNRYVKFISTRIPNGTIFEKHHILPRSIFPSFESDEHNIIKLTPREHFIAHHLLFKSFPQSPAMRYAFWAMCNWKSNSQSRNYKISSKLYQNIKTNYSLYMSEKLSANNPYTSSENKKNIIDKYGGLGNASPQIFEKQKETMLKKYGVDNIFKDPNFIQQNALKSKERWLDVDYKKKVGENISLSKKNQHVVRCSCIKCHRIIQSNNLTNHFRWKHD